MNNKEEYLNPKKGHQLTGSVSDHIKEMRIKLIYSQVEELKENPPNNYYGAIIEHLDELETAEILGWVEDSDVHNAKKAFLEKELRRLKRESEKETGKSDANKPERESIHQLIETFAELFAEDADYSKTAIQTYIVEWQKRDGITTQRAKAKRAAKKKCAELKQIKSDGTFSNWENKWTEFHASRTGK